MHSLFNDYSTGTLSSQRAPCLSLYQPTHRHRPGSQQDVIRFGNLVKAMEASLVRKYPASEVRQLLDPLRALGADGLFWNHNQAGLCVLAAPGFFRAYRLLRPVPERAIVAESFHLKPLLRIMQSADSYHVLALNRQHTRLFEGNRDSLQEVEMMAGIRTLTEALGEEVSEPHLTVASYGGAGGASATHHGHGSRKDEIDIDTERYFRAVDRWVLEHYSRPSGLPLVLAALGEHQTPFRRVAQNPFLVTDGIHVDPWALDIDELCTRAWSVVEPQYLAMLAVLVDRFGAARGKELASDAASEIARAALAGRVATLLIEAERVVPGRINRETGTVGEADMDNPEVDDVLDELGELVLKSNGSVVVVPSDRMPARTGVAAIYRF